MADLRARNNLKLAKAKRIEALRRSEIGQPTSPRVAAASPTSMAVKVTDPETRRLIEDFQARRRGYCPWCKIVHGVACVRLISGGQGD